MGRSVGSTFGCMRSGNALVREGQNRNSTDALVTYFDQKGCPVKRASSGRVAIFGIAIAASILTVLAGCASKSETASTAPTGTEVVGSDAGPTSTAESSASLQSGQSETSARTAESSAPGASGIPEVGETGSSLPSVLDFSLFSPACPSTQAISTISGIQGLETNNIHWSNKTPTTSPNSDLPFAQCGWTVAAPSGVPSANISIQLTQTHSQPANQWQQTLTDRLKAAPAVKGAELEISTDGNAWFTYSDGFDALASNRNTRSCSYSAAVTPTYALTINYEYFPDDYQGTAPITSLEQCRNVVAELTSSVSGKALTSSWARWSGESDSPASATSRCPTDSNVSAILKRVLTYHPEVSLSASADHGQCYYYDESASNSPSPALLCNP